MNDGSNRIPAAKVRGLTAWALPEVKHGQIIQVEKTRHRDATGRMVSEDKNAVVYQQMTAGQLDELSDQLFQEVEAQAKEAGYKAGHQQGYQEGMAAAQHVVQQQAHALSQVVAALHDVLQRQDNETEQVLANLAISVAGSVLQRELTIDSSQVVAVVHDCLRALPADDAAPTIFLSQQDCQLLREYSDYPADWKLQTDSSLTPGGCRVQRGASLVEHTLEEQFKQTVDAVVAPRFEALNPEDGSQ
jgi:flagellar assembly protein FliH